MKPLAAGYFDGQTSQRHEVSVLFDGGKVRLAPRLANTPRWIYLPGGGACVILDNDAVDRFARDRHSTRMLNQLEARPAIAVMAVALVVGLLWLLIDRGLPPAVKYVAEKIPRSAEVALGEKTLEAFDDGLLKQSSLPRAREQALREGFAKLSQAA